MNAQLSCGIVDQLLFIYIKKKNYVYNLKSHFLLVYRESFAKDQSVGSADLFSATTMENPSDEERMGIPERHISQTPPAAVNSREPKPDTPKPLVAVKEVDNSDSGDLEDPQEVLKSSCRETSLCSQLFEELGVCNDRVNSREKTKETCEQELYDFVGCVDSCVSKSLFKRLK